MRFRLKVNLRTALKAEAFGAGGFAARLSGFARSPFWSPPCRVPILFPRGGRLHHPPGALRLPSPLKTRAQQAAKLHANTAALRQARCARWSVLAGGQQGALGARHSPQINLFRFTPQFFHVCLPCECNSVRGLCKRLSRHKPRLSSPCRHFVPQGSPAAIYSTSAPLRVVTTFPTSLCKDPEPNSFIHTANAKKLGRKS
jgi:hypothetical protein